VKDELLLGRSDMAANLLPDLDLTPFGGQAAGVSRRHALIIRREGALYVQDLNSTNGSKLNNVALPGGQQYPLSDGDILELGRLLITIRFVNTPL
jgi:pSer/pThr/pTyr-binding forkhead associated (FHA) protein